MPRIALPAQHFTTTITAAALPLAGWALHTRHLHRRLEVARRDPLTGLYGRDAFTEAATWLIRRSPLALVVLIDLDGFKALNDTAGHAAGDAVLAHTASRLDGWATIGAAGRFGGDEFTAVLPLNADDADGEDGPLTELSWLHYTLTKPVPHGGDLLSVRASVGGYLATPAVSLSEALTAADAAMYAAKLAGGGWDLASAEAMTRSRAAPRRWRRNRPATLARWAA